MRMHEASASDWAYADEILAPMSDARVLRTVL